MIKDGKSACNINGKVKLLRYFWKSVYSFEENFKVKDIQPEILTLTNFSLTRNEIYQIPIGLDVTKSRGQNGYPPVFYQKTAERMSAILHIIMRNKKRLRKSPKSGK